MAYTLRLPAVATLPWLMVYRFDPIPEDRWVARVWCPHCHRDHHHSSSGGHRVAHCADGPFCETGYILVAPKRLVDGLPVRERREWRGYTL